MGINHCRLRVCEHDTHGDALREGGKRAKKKTCNFFRRYAVPLLRVHCVLFVGIAGAVYANSVTLRNPNGKGFSAVMGVLQYSAWKYG